MKNCDVCGTWNLKENNYCTHCGCSIVEINICPFCGQVNPDANDFCIKCHNQITPIFIDSFDVLFSDYNRSLIINAHLSDDEYLNILKRMFKKLDYFSITGNTPKEKVLQIANVFTYVVPKSSGIEYGEYGCTIIFYDDRLDDSIQISTIIHELAHFLLFELCESMLCEIFDVKSSSVLKAFVEYFLTSPETEVINEFYAHTVENRFIPLQFQSFNSFLSCAASLGLSDEDAVIFIQLGNSYAQDIIHFLEHYIDENLRELIKLQFKRDMVKPKGNIDYNFEKGLLPISEKNKYLIGLMALCFESLYNNKEARKELEYQKIKFEDYV
jgi:hypothetical protein